MTAATWIAFYSSVGFVSMFVSLAVNARGYTTKRKLEGALTEVLVGMILIPCAAALITSGMTLDPVDSNQVLACVTISGLLGMLIGDATSKGNPRRVAERFSRALWKIAKVLVPAAFVMRLLIWAFNLTDLHSYFAGVAFLAGVVAFTAAVAKTIHLQYEDEQMMGVAAHWATFVCGVLCLFIPA